MQEGTHYLEKIENAMNLMSRALEDAKRGNYHVTKDHFTIYQTPDEIRDSQRRIFECIARIFKAADAMRDGALRMHRIPYEKEREYDDFIRSDSSENPLEVMRSIDEKYQDILMHTLTDATDYIGNARRDIAGINRIVQRYGLEPIFGPDDSPSEVAITLATEYAHYFDSLMQMITWKRDHSQEKVLAQKPAHFGYTKLMSDLADGVMERYEKLDGEEKAALDKYKLKVRKKVDEIDISVVRLLPPGKEFGAPYEGMLRVMDVKTGEISRVPVTMFIEKQPETDSSAKMTPEDLKLAAEKDRSGTAADTERPHAYVFCKEWDRVTAHHVPLIEGNITETMPIGPGESEQVDRKYTFAPVLKYYGYQPGQPEAVRHEILHRLLSDHPELASKGSWYFNQCRNGCTKDSGLRHVYQSDLDYIGSIKNLSKSKGKNKDEKDHV